jgi:hypothetical protein
MKCSNCSADAVYNVIDPGVSPAYYCATCLPKSLRNRADAGQLDLPKPVAKKSTKKVVEEVVEEPVVETPVETPAPSEDSDEDPAV